MTYWSFSYFTREIIHYEVVQCSLKYRIFSGKAPSSVMYVTGKCMILFLLLSEYVNQGPKVNIGVTSPKIRHNDQLSKVFVTLS